MSEADDSRPGDPSAPSSSAAEDVALPVNRRSWLQAALWGGGLTCAGGLAGWIARRSLKSPTLHTPSSAPLSSAFSYDISRFQRSDPQLLRYDESSRFHVDLTQARHLAVADDGSIHVGGQGGIRQYSATGTPARSTLLDTTVTCVHPHANGGWLAGFAGGMIELDPDGRELKRWPDLSAEFLPTSIAVAGPWIFVADAGKRVLHKFDHSGRRVKLIGGRHSPGHPGFVIPSPYFCVRKAPDGLLRVSNPGEHRIETFTLDGDFETSWGKGSFAVDGFCGCCNPISFDLFADGSYVTCEKGLARVKLYNSSGEFAGLVAGPEMFPEYAQAANGGSPAAMLGGIHAVADNPRRRVIILDSVSSTIRVMTPKATAP